MQIIEIKITEIVSHTDQLLKNKIKSIFKLSMQKLSSSLIKVYLAGYFQNRNASPVIALNIKILTRRSLWRITFLSQEYLIYEIIL